MTDRSWRSNDDDPPVVARRQEGISPKSFHNAGNRRPRTHLTKLLQESANSVIRQQRKEVSQQIKLKRAAFKAVTSLKTWPLQEMALKDLKHWNLVHLGGNHNNQQAVVDAIPDTDVETHGDSTGLSSSSLEEPKRVRRGRDSDDEQDLSPRKSTLRHSYQQDFIKERDLLAGLEDDEKLHSALWCMEPRIFAIEKNAAGKRKYLVGHFGRLMDYYWRKSDPKQRHFYELIREKTPCRLYFDLEFSKLANPDISEQDTELLLDEFAEELIHEFRTMYEIDLTRDDIVDLDSTTDKKFSRHWIVHLPNGALFADATAVGRFVRVFVGRLAEALATGQMERETLAKHLFVNAAPSKAKGQRQASSKICFIDLGVYTRNRLFRVLGSCKYGKPPSAALRIASTNTFPLDVSNEGFYLPAIAAAKTAQHDAAELDDDMKKFQSSVDWTSHADALAATLVVPMNVMKRNFPILQDSAAAKVVDEADTTPQLSSSSLMSDTASSRSAVSTVKVGSSPFPYLDRFVLQTLATRHGIHGSIRGWSIDYVDDARKHYKSIAYQMSRNRWCEAIGRPHKSNNIMWTIDFTTMDATQACHDPDCRAMRFRGQPHPLPDDIQEELRDALFEHELVQLDEAELLKKQPKKQSPRDQFEFDDEEFEKALLNLKINGEDTPKKSNTENAAKKPSTPNFDSIDDGDWMKALESNPELFP